MARKRADEVPTEEIQSSAPPAPEAPAEESAPSPESKCPVSVEEFMQGAQSFTIQLADGAAVLLKPKRFSTGSFGWFANDKVLMDVEGTPVKVQANLLLTVIGSKGA